MKRIALLTAVLALGCSEPKTATNEGSGDKAARQGTPAPDFTARDLKGNTFRLSDHLGKRAILLDFWQTFCEPCKAEFPHLDELYRKNKDKGFIVVAVSMDGPETLAEVPGFVQRYSLTFPVVTDEDSRVASLYNPRKSAPLAVLIDKTGKVVVVREGYNPGDEDLVAKDVAKVLEDAPAPTPAAPTPAPTST